MQSQKEMTEYLFENENFNRIIQILQVKKQVCPEQYQQLSQQLRKMLILQPQLGYIQANKVTKKILILITYLFKEEQTMDAAYFEVQSGFVLLAIVEGYLQQGLNAEKINKLKHYFGRRVQKGKLWGFQKLQNLQAYLIDARTGLFPVQSNKQHQNELERINYFCHFCGTKGGFLPPLFQVGTILFKMMLCLKEDRPTDKIVALNLRSLYFSQHYHYESTLRNMKFALEFMRHPLNDKQCLYYPQKALQSILSNYKSPQITQLIKKSSIGMTWGQQEVYEYFLNCIKLGITDNSYKMMIGMIRFCEDSSRLQELLHSYEMNLNRIFIFMKYPRFFPICLDLLKIFLFSPPPSAVLFSKFLSQLEQILPKLDQVQKVNIIEVANVIAYTYKSTLPINGLQKLIADFDSSSFTEEKIKKIIQQYKWKEAVGSKGISKFSAISSKKKQGLRGLVNIGNSCYMNSFLQSLFMNREFLGIVLESSTLQIRSKLLQDNKKYQGKTRQIVQKDIQQTVKPFAQLQKLFSLLFKSIRSEISPLNIRQIGPEAFRNSSQHDTIEFGRAFLDLIFRNKLSNIFEGQVNTSIECEGCGKIRERREAFIDLHLPVEAGQLQDLIQNSLGDESVSGLTCDNCGLLSQQSIKRHQISRFPPYLIFSINRFEYDSVQKRVNKNKARINASPIVELNGNKYSLYSLIVHTGPSPNAGHYFSFSRIGLESESKWVCHNDAQVSEFSGLTQVKSFLESSEEDTPYVLFYENIEYISNKKEQLSKPILLRAPQEQFVRKDDEIFLNSVRKTTFNLQPSNYIFFDKQQEEDRGSGGNGGGGFYNSYIS